MTERAQVEVTLDTRTAEQQARALEQRVEDLESRARAGGRASRTSSRPGGQQSIADQIKSDVLEDILRGRGPGRGLRNAFARIQKEKLGFEAAKFGRKGLADALKGELGLRTSAGSTARASQTAARAAPQVAARAGQAALGGVIGSLGPIALGGLAFAAGAAIPVAAAAGIGAIATGVSEIAGSNLSTAAALGEGFGVINSDVAASIRVLSIEVNALANRVLSLESAASAVGEIAVNFGEADDALGLFGLLTVGEAARTAAVRDRIIAQRQAAIRQEGIARALRRAGGDAADLLGRLIE